VVSFPSPADVERIGAIADPLLRNLQITQAYHELSTAITQRTGEAANWCTFATWASKQAGQTIRKEDLKRSLQDLLSASAEARQAAEALAPARPAVQSQVWHAITPVSAIDRASDAVARGNKKVFDEIGLIFSRFLNECAFDEAYEPASIARFTDTLHAGDPPDGQRFLRQAFARYYQSFFESDAARRLELLLLANLEIGFHEQTRLQPEIAESLEAAFTGPDPLARRVASLLFPGYAWLTLSLAALRRLLGRPSLTELTIQTLVALARRETRRLITETMMSIALPGGVHLRLGDDLRGDFPDSLQRISDPELRSFLAQIDPTPDSPRGSGARDWASLPDRLHFIADLFRCYADSPSLLEPPFSLQQVEAIKSGRRPAGML
jgi:hypothetical protein